MQTLPCDSKSVRSSGIGARRPGTEPWRRCMVVSLLTLTFVAPEVSASRHAHVVTSEAAWMGAPVVVLTISADPQVVCPTELPGDCDFVQRLLVANEAVYQHSHLVAISLFGGLYGP